ncbi:threonine-phosphate decarboxylase CobD [Salaquimonas pukyongi]|uniref:threonine-phosphate decarboxylase CobD n=1 Tax=Salaquimonas pukyongi TaxID=2712698 RepID=UPI001FCD76BD|nr:threonine-phosphate decarboxylase CobD [Salaquimonas pukyongi]
MGERIAHGGGLDAAMMRYGGERAGWLDLSTGINPNAYPLPPIKIESWQRLPDRGAEDALKAAARACYCVPEEAAVVVANGTQALIELLPRVLDADQIAVVTPTYGEHAHVWRKSGLAVSEIRHGEPVPEAARVLVVVNPNNPDCRVTPQDQLLVLAESMRARAGWLVIDEAFCDTSPQASLIPLLPENVIVLRSFGKFFGLAGLRLGFAVCSPALAEALEELQGPWSVSGPALSVGARALQDTSWVAKTRRRLQNDSQAMAGLLKAQGFAICGVHPLFVFAGHERATEIADGLAQRHILVRDFETLPGRLRFGLCGDEAAFSRLEIALSQVMADGGAMKRTSGHEAHG